MHANNNQTIGSQRLYTTGEEIANSISHGLGVLFGAVATVLMIYHGVMSGNTTAIVAFTLYGVCTTLMFLSSTLYHAITNVTVKKILRVFDHCAIFLSIAGCYCPVCLLAIGGMEGILLLSVVSAIAIGGIVFKIVTYGKYEKYKKVSLLLYILMGWVIVFSIKDIYLETSAGFIGWIATGGFMYTLGTFFYKNKKVPFNHAIWHGFVLIASILQFVGIYTTFVII